MPSLTRLMRDQDLCWSTWRHPTNPTQVIEGESTMTARAIQTVLAGGLPPRPAGVPSDWVFVSARLERQFVGGQQAIGPNEIGDVSGWNGTEKAPPLLRGVIQEIGDDPVEIELREGQYTEDQTGRISATVESTTTNRTGNLVRYAITNGVAVKMSER